jgi:hypothetical protein
VLRLNVSFMLDSLPSPDASNGSPATFGARARLNLLDSQLDRFLPIVRRALERKSTVIALQLWERTPTIALLPFHLYLRWPERIELLSLNATFGFAPYFASDQAIVSGANVSYGVSDASTARERARRNRGQAGTDQPNDFRIPDWEQGYQRHSDELKDTNLAGSSFLGVDVVSADGEIGKGNRSVLGRVAVRNAHRPFLLVPSRGGVSNPSAQLLAAVDLLIINLQGVRGRNALDSIRTILSVRASNSSTLVVASSPSDLLALDLPSALQSAEILCLGTAPAIADVGIVTVSANRYLEDRNFEFAVDDLRGRSGAMDHLVELAKRAWWASQQSLGQIDLDPEIKRFESALERMASNVSDDASLFTMGKDLISGVAADRERATARRAAVTDAAINTSGKSGVLIVARGTSARIVREEMSSLLDLPVNALSDLGVRVESPFSYSAFGMAPPDVVIVAGYFGLPTIDKILSSGGRTVRLVLDPIEARAAWWGIRKLVRFQKEHGVNDGIAALERLADGIAGAIPTQLRSVTTDLEILPTWFDFPTMPKTLVDAMRTYVENSSNVIVFLTDGTQLDVGENTRFDLLGTMGTHLKTIIAKQLSPGDEIILLDEDSRGLFSEHLISALDTGVLKDAAEQRQLWLMLVRAQIASRNIKPSTVAGRLAEVGDHVNTATLRSWIVDEGAEARVPNSRERFLRLASALDIDIPDEKLVKMFDGIKRVRIGHRVAGRKLGRTIRAAYLDRLDASALSRIQKEWGLDILQLIESARVAVVDEVVLPPEL